MKINIINTIINTHQNLVGYVQVVLSELETFEHRKKYVYSCDVM